MTSPSPFGKISTALGLFASCIKSGEDWSPECEAANRDAHDALFELSGEIIRLEACLADAERRCGNAVAAGD